MASDLQRSPTRPVQQNHADSNDFCDLISPETPSVVSSRIMQASVVSQKFIEVQPQVLRLILAQNAPKFAQDDSLFVMRTSDSPR
jgi:hypothetical protein